MRTFVQMHEKSSKKLITMQGDPVHPGAPGQLTMAAALLKDLGADGFVSSATVDAAGKKVEAKWPHDREHQNGGRQAVV